MSFPCPARYRLILLSRMWYWCTADSVSFIRESWLFAVHQSSCGKLMLHNLHVKKLLTCNLCPGQLSFPSPWDGEWNNSLRCNIGLQHECQNDDTIATTMYGSLLQAANVDLSVTFQQIIYAVSCAKSWSPTSQTTGRKFHQFLSACRWHLSVIYQTSCTCCSLHLSSPHTLFKISQQVPALCLHASPRQKLTTRPCDERSSLKRNSG